MVARVVVRDVFETNAYFIIDDATGIGLTKFPGGDQPTLIRSLETRILALPQDTTLLSGHSGPIVVADFPARR